MKKLFLLLILSSSFLSGMQENQQAQQKPLAYKIWEELGNPGFPNLKFSAALVNTKKTKDEIMRWLAPAEVKEYVLKLKKDLGVLLTTSTRPRDFGLAKLLVNQGADISADILAEASAYGNQDLVKLLLEHGADVNAKDSSDLTPLLRAIYNDHPATATLLIEHGADVNTKNKSGETALFSATRQALTNLVELLINRGADINAINLRNETVLDIARSAPHRWTLPWKLEENRRIIELLENARKGKQ